jgi:hypothetical protein
MTPEETWADARPLSATSDSAMRCNRCFILDLRTKLSRLELITERELQLALTALGGDLAEVGARPVTTSAAPIRMIGPVEGFHAEGEFMSFFYDEVFHQANVVVLETRVIDQIAHALAVECTDSRIGEDAVGSIGSC